jgi:hypothetical protein
VSNKSIIVCTGQSSKKSAQGETAPVDVTPIVCVDTTEEFGVGVVMVNDKGEQKVWVWGLMWPRKLIQSWRAMKMLEEAPRIVNGTLCLAWTLSLEDVYGSSDEKYLDELGIAFGGHEKFREVRAKVLAMFPTDEELKAMLAVVQEHELEVRFEEIEEERKKLSSKEEILKRLCIADEDRHVRNRLEAEARAKREAERVKIPNPATLPNRKSFFHRLFG